jgi:hypothetical protein
LFGWNDNGFAKLTLEELEHSSSYEGTLKFTFEKKTFGLDVKNFFISIIY